MGFYTLEMFQDMGNKLPLCPSCEKQFGKTGYLEIFSPHYIPKVKTHQKHKGEKWSKLRPLEITDCDISLIPLSCWMDEKYIHYHGTNFGLPEGSNVLTHEADRYGRYNRKNMCPLVTED